MDVAKKGDVAFQLSNVDDVSGRVSPSSDAPPRTHNTRRFAHANARACAWVVAPPPKEPVRDSGEAIPHGTWLKLCKHPPAPGKQKARPANEGRTVEGAVPEGGPYADLLV